MIKYFGFNKTLGIGRFFSFGTDTSGGDSGGIGDASTIAYLSFPLTRTSEGINVSALPLAMNRINLNYVAEQAV